MWRAFVNILKVKELRNRLLFTALIIVLVRVASNIPCPGINPAALERFIRDVTQSSGSEGGFVQLIDLFSGGALAHFALGALGIMPYITASIILQLLVPVIPQLEKMQREGESGRSPSTPAILRFWCAWFRALWWLWRWSTLPNCTCLSLRSRSIWAVLRSLFR